MNMLTYRALHDLPPTPHIATIGNFDGVHRGHRWVIDQVNTRARSLGIPSLAITFDPHPVRLLRPDAPHSLITPLPEKLALLATTGIDSTLVVPFTEALSRLTPEAFAREILCDACHIREIHEGETFRFGSGGAGDMQTLATLGRQLNFTAHPHPPLLFRGSAVSSSRIRTLIAAGDVSHARPLLCRPFSIRSTPARGRGYGTRYTVPTINLAPYLELLPAHGVYITTLQVGLGAPHLASEMWDDSPRTPRAPFIANAMSGSASDTQVETFQSVTNIGNRPTFGADSFAVESHLLNFHPIELTEDTPLTLTFLKRLRPERKFPTPEALRTQIAHDVRRAQHYFTLASRLSPVSAPS